MEKTGKKLAALLLAAVMVLAFIPGIGTQTVHAAADEITKVEFSLSPSEINRAFWEGDYVRQPEISITSVESVSGQVTADDLVFDMSDYYGWCRAADTDWIKYSDDGVQGLWFTGGESRFMIDLSPADGVDAVFSEDCEFCIYDEKMSFYKAYASGDVVYYLSRYATEPTGSCGDNVNYVFDETTGELTITGSGPMKDYGNGTQSPFYSIRTEITKLTIGEGVTTIGSVATGGMENCASVSLPSTLEKIGWADFSNFKSLKEITLPVSLREIESQAFDGTGLETINYLGTQEQWAEVNVSSRGNEILATDALKIQGHTHHFVVTKTVAADCGNDGYVIYTCDCGSSYQEVTEPATGDHAFDDNGICTVCGQRKLPDPDARSGRCGDNVNWVFDEESGVLTITGTGPIMDYGNSIYSPFHPIRYLVTSLIIEEGVTAIGGVATGGMENCTSVSLPGTLEMIGWADFSGFSALKEITLPVALKEIEKYAFNNTDLETVNYMGTEEQWAQVDAAEEGNSTLLTLGPAGFHYWGEGTVVTEPTCGEPGVRSHVCSACGKTMTQTIPATGDHVYETTVTKATLTADGRIDSRCSVCGYEEPTVTISRPKTFKLSAAFYEYDGKAHKPTVKVTDAAGKVISSANYTVTYESGRKNAGSYKVTVMMKGDRYEGSKSLTFKITAKKITPAVTLSKTSYVYDGKVKKPTVTVKDGTTVLKQDTDYTVTYAAGRKNAGSYKVTVTLKGNYSGTASKTFKITKAANPLAIKGKTATVRYVDVKKKTQTLAVSKVIEFTNKGKGTLSYAKVSGNAKITISKTTGSVTVAKGLKKGTYSVKVKVKAAGNDNYKASVWKTTTFKITVK